MDAQLADFSQSGHGQIKGLPLRRQPQSAGGKGISRLGDRSVHDTGRAPSAFKFAYRSVQDFADGSVAAIDGYASVRPVFQAAEFGAGLNGIGNFLSLGKTTRPATQRNKTRPAGGQVIL